MFVIKYKKIFFGISTLLVLVSLVSIFSHGLKFGVDFTGGSILEVSYTGDFPQKIQVEDAVKESGIEQVSVRQAGDSGYIIKTEIIDEIVKEEISNKLGTLSEGFNLDRFNTVGPTLGNELKSRAILALVVLVFAIVLFIAYTFREVSKPVSSWKYGMVAVIALVHDVIITLGFFSIIGAFYGVEIDTLFVTALLVILGYSINDTIVVLDRVRENLRDIEDDIREQKFDNILGQSLKETFTRSINTSITTLLALGALLVFGGIATQNFALALIVGIIVGSYSSLFLATPLLISFKNRKEK